MKTKTYAALVGLAALLLVLPYSANAIGPDDLVAVDSPMETMSATDAYAAFVIDTCYGEAIPEGGALLSTPNGVVVLKAGETGSVEGFVPPSAEAVQTNALLLVSHYKCCECYAGAASYCSEYVKPGEVCCCSYVVRDWALDCSCREGYC
ncbi:MAG TPA: hypothetical protein VNZ52_04760 [Candidatus Thermoplasmatota archaeon]|nr:hypothetical protein [Candidatus Thermoplasmatota archaeon]